MAHQTELDLFQTYCRHSPITVEFLIANQIKYDFVNDHIIQYICLNPKLTVQVFQWLLSNYPDSILDYFESILTRLYKSVRPMEEYILMIDHIIKIKGNLYWKLNSRHNILHWIFVNKSFDVPMLNYLYQRVPQLDIGCEDTNERSPLYYVIVYSSRLLELLQVIKSYELANSRVHIKVNIIYDANSNTHIQVKYMCDTNTVQLAQAINRYAKHFNQSTICALIGLCGELFPLIEIEYLTQDICNQFYSSKYFQWSTDQDFLIKLIPEQFQNNLRNVNSHGLKTKPALRI
jgi:hypothetical protein